MTSSDEIRETFLSFFESRDHRRQSSGSLVPAAYDPSVLLTTAGMHPLKPYFLGEERPPYNRLTSCQKCFRTVDIENVGNTARHLTFFEMLGNFSIGDYFKQGAIEYAWELSLERFGFDPERIWITVFEGDDELGLGPDEEAIAAWEAVGVPRARIVPCPRSENFWQAGPTGPCGPCSELYLDRGLEFGSADDLPGGENERFLEYWNLVFMQFNQAAGTLAPLPSQNIDTGLGLNRLAAILQDAPSVFETDQFRPLIRLGEELSGVAYGSAQETDRALRILADHTRGMTFLVADGIVPSNEDRGYVLRRLMRRAIQQGRVLELEPGFLPRYAEVVREVMGAAYPEIIEQREAVDSWLTSEEESFGRTLEQGMHTLAALIEAGRAQGSIPAEEAFRLHDTYGFPFEVTKELLADEGLTVDEAAFEQLMAKQRARSRAVDGGGGAAAGDVRGAASSFAAGAGFVTRFTGYETVEQSTTVGALEQVDGRVLVKLSESPFYAAGGGQVSDAGVIECADGDCRATVADVLRLGDDQAVLAQVERGELHAGERVVARVDRGARHATACNHTATHLLHAALRARLGTHVRQAGSYVGPDKLRFDFSHTQALSAQELRDVEDQVNEWILADHPVRPITTTLDEAKTLGAMALFGEKYGDIVRMVEIGDGDFSRELCGGTHVRATAEIGMFTLLSETSSAANVRRIEALTGREAVTLARRRSAELAEVAALLRARPEEVVDAVREREAQRRELEKAARREQVASQDVARESLELDFGKVVTASTEGGGGALREVADRLRAEEGEDSVILLGGRDGAKASLLVAVPKALAERIDAREIIGRGAPLIAGRGGGRPTLAQAGGDNVEGLTEALQSMREALTGS
jgi:alanyl-tRNA synthetase